MSEIEILINIIKKKSNAVTALAIIIITVLCITIATNFIQGNRKKKSKIKTNYSRQVTTTTIITSVVVLTIVSTKVS